MIRRPPESTRAYTPLPSTTLFRSSRTSHRHRASMTLSIRSAAPADLPLIAQFIRALADYEKLAHAVRFDEATLGDKLFGPRPYAEVIIGEIDGMPQGFALFFHNFHTFSGKPGLYPEACSVSPEARGAG